MTRKRQASNKANPSSLRRLVLLTLIAVVLVNFAQSADAQTQEWINPEGGLASNPDNWDTGTLPTGDLIFGDVSSQSITVTFDELVPTSNSHSYGNDTQWTVIPTSLHTIANDLTIYYTTTIQDGSIQVNGDTIISHGDLIIDGGTFNGPANPSILEFDGYGSGRFKVTNAGAAFIDRITLFAGCKIEVGEYGHMRVHNSIDIPEYTDNIDINVHSNGTLIVEQDIKASGEDSRITINVDGGLLDVKGSIFTGEFYPIETSMVIESGTVNVGGSIHSNDLIVINGGIVNANMTLAGPDGLSTTRLHAGTFINGGRINGIMNISEEREGIITGGQTQTINLTGENIWTIEGGFVENFTIANDSHLDIDGGDIANLAVLGHGEIDMTDGNVDLATVTSTANLSITGGSMEILGTAGQSTATVDGGTFFGGIVAMEQSSVVVNNGDITEIVAVDAGDITINGGEIDILSAMDDSLITLYMQTLDIYDMNGGEFGNGLLEGTWADGQAFSIDLRDDFNDTSDHLVLFADHVAADANDDGMVGLLDLNILGDNFGMPSGATADMGDFNGDGSVGLLDLNILGQQYGLEYQPASTTTSVPEPSSLAWLLGAAACLTARRRKSASATTTHTTQQIKPTRVIVVAFIAGITLAFATATSARTLVWNAPGGGDLYDENWLPAGETIDDDYSEPAEIDDDLVFNLDCTYTITNNFDNWSAVRSMSFNQGDITYKLSQGYYSAAEVYDSVYLAPQPGDQVTLSMDGLDDGWYTWQIRNAMLIGGSNQGQGGKATFNLTGGMNLSVFGTVRVFPGSELNVNNAKIIADTVEVLGKLNVNSDDYLDTYENVLVYPSELQTNLSIKQSGSANIRGGKYAYNGIAVSGSGQLNFIDAYAQHLTLSMESQARIGSGEIPQIVASGNSIVDIFGGDIETLAFYDDATIRLYAEYLDISPTGTGEFGHGIATGTWYNGDPFTIQLLNLGPNDTHDYISVAQFAPGDVNGDGIVNLIDLDILGQNYDQVVSSRLLGDINSDGIVGLLDLDLLGQNFTSEVLPPAPEPATLTLIALAAACITKRKH